MSAITLDHPNLIAFGRVSGFLDTEQILRVLFDTDDAIQSFGNRMSKHGRIFDLSDAKVASPESISALCDMTIDQNRIPFRANRVAFFGASALAKSQIKRLCAIRSGSAMFDDRHAAYAWVTGGR